MIPAENPASVTETLRVQRVAVHVVLVMRATGAWVSWTLLLFWGGTGCGAGGPGITGVVALAAMLAPPALVAVTMQRRAVPASWAPTVYVGCGPLAATPTSPAAVERTNW